MPGADVQLWGRKLPGARKYLGGSPNGEKPDALLGVPSHSQSIVRLEILLWGPPVGH